MFVVCLPWAFVAFLYQRAAPPAANVAGPMPYLVAHDAPLDVSQKLLPDPETTAQHKRWRVEFNGIKGARVPAYCYIPNDGTGRHPAVLVQAGLTGNKDVSYVVPFARYLADRGFVVLSIDMPGAGERKIAGGEKTQMLLLHNRDNFVECLGDYSRAIDYLVTRNDVDSERLAYVGYSWSAVHGITFVAHEPRIKAMICIDGAGNFFNCTRGNLSNSNDRFGRLDPIYHVGLIAPRPLLFISVTHDQYMPAYCIECLHQAAGKGSKVVWVETDHLFHNVDHQKSLRDNTQFLIESLGMETTFAQQKVPAAGGQGTGNQ